MIKKIALFFMISIGSFLFADIESKFYVNQMLIDFTDSQEKEIGINTSDACLHSIKEIAESGKYIILEDESVWLVGWYYRGSVQKWQPNHRIKLIFDEQYSNNIQFINSENGDSAWGVIEKIPKKHLSSFILRFSNSVFESDDESKIILDNGLIFRGPKVPWKVREQIFIFHSPSEDGYDLWNIARGEVYRSWNLVGNENQGSPESFFNIEDQLNEQVLGQQEAIQSITSVLFNCWAGLNDPKLPIGVFLFLGPTGVGKTELAKALAERLYNNPNRLIRFDMSQFVTQYDYTRLIGSPPGYVDSHEGGQLTEALKTYPASIVLLDEIEKAHSSIRKAFLPIFDEGYVADAKNSIVPCNRAIFILTGNICSEKIAHLFHQGYDSEEVIKMIEPNIISGLSPELYNRLTTVAFRPITPDLMESLVKQKLNQVIQQLKHVKNITLTIDSSVNSYLITHGYHSTLGVRPLKRLIQNKILSFLAYAIIKDGIPEGSTMVLSYLEQNDSWNIDWTL